MSNKNKVIEVVISEDNDFVLPVSIAALNNFDMIAVTEYLKTEDASASYKKACEDTGKAYYYSDSKMYFFQQHIKDAMNEMQAMELSHQKAFINSDVSVIRRTATGMYNYTNSKLQALDMRIADKISDWDSKYQIEYDILVEQSLKAKTYEELSLIQNKLKVLDGIKNDIETMKRERVALIDQINKQNKQKLDVFKDINKSTTIDSSKSTIALVNIGAAKENEHGKLDNFDKIVAGGDIIDLEYIEKNKK